MKSHIHAESSHLRLPSTVVFVPAALELQMRPRLRRSRLSTQHEKHQGHPLDCPSWPSAAVPSEPSSYSVILSAILVAIPRAIPLLVEGVRSDKLFAELN